MAQDSSSTETAPQERTGLSSNPADYLTGPTSAERRSRQGGTTRDGGVAYATDSGTSNEQSAAGRAADAAAADRRGHAEHLRRSGHLT
jgi:hypothetical protein